MKTRLSIERVLLTAILGMQLVIAWGLFRPDQEPLDVADAGDPVVPDEFVASEPVLPPRVSPVMMVPRRDPFGEMDAFFAGAFENMARLRSAMHIDEGWDALRTSPTMDMRDGESDYLVSFSIPGADASDIDVSLAGRVLTVQALTPVRGPYSTRLQRFERRVLLPGPVGVADDAHASITNGILRVHVPKGSDGSPQLGTFRLF